MSAVGYFAPTSSKGADLRIQEARFYQYCDAERVSPLATFSDPETDLRPGFQRLIQFLERSPRGVSVLVASPETLGVLPEQAASRLLEAETLGAQVRTFDDGDADLLAALLTDRRKKRRPRGQASEQLQQKAMQAHGLGKPPFGYRIGPEGRFVVVQDEAVTVQLIYRLYVQEGMGLRLVAGRLNEQGVTTRRGARWSVVTVRDILRNPVYQGTYIRYGLMVSGSHTAVVSREIFRRAQEQRRAAATDRGEPQEVSFALSGLTVCGYCEATMVGATRHQSWTRKDRSRIRAIYRYYRCGSRVNQSLCGYHTHRAEDLEAGVAADIVAHWTNDAGFDAAGFHLARAQALRAGLASAAKDAVSGRMDAKQLRSVAEDLLGAARTAEEAASQAEPVPAASRRGGSLPAWLGFRPEEQQAILRGLLRRVVVFDDRRETEVRTSEV